MGHSNKKDKILVVNKYEANLVCYFVDGNNHSEQHNIKLVVDLVNNNSTGLISEIENKLCKKAANELHKIGKMSLFRIGFIKSKLFGCSIGIKDGDYVFYKETEIECIKGKVIYPSQGNEYVYYIIDPETKERTEVTEIKNNTGQRAVNELSLEEGIDKILKLRKLSKRIVAFTFAISEEEEQNSSFIILRFDNLESNKQLILGIPTDAEGELLLEKEPSMVSLGNEDLLEEYMSKRKQFYFSRDQKLLIETALAGNKTYRFIKDAFRWYNQDNAVKKVSELFSDGLIEWELEEEPQTSNSQIPEDLNLILSYNAEYGDAKYRFLSYENEEGEEFNYLEINVESYYESIILLASEDVKKIGLGDIYIHEFALEDVLVKTESASCLEKEHVVDRVRARVSVIRKDTWDLEEYEIEAYFCSTCNRYYILEKDYIKLRNIGILLCRVTDSSDIKSNFSSWAAEHLLKQCGYSVAKNNGLSTKERHVILEFVIESGIMSKADVLSHLEWLVRQNSSRQNFKEAISKWNDDIMYLQGGKRLTGSDIRIRNIIEKYKR